MTNKNLTFQEINPPEVVDNVYDQIISNVYKVYWKGGPFLRIASCVNTHDSETVFIEDEDGDEVPEVPETTTTTTYLLYCEWPLYKYHHGEFSSLTLAMEATHGVADQMEQFLREKFFKKVKPNDQKI